MKQSNKEKDYIQAYIDGDDAACDALFKLFYPQLLLFCSSRLSGVEASYVKDIILETTEILYIERERVLKNIKKSESLKSYLFTIAKNKTISLYRRKIRHIEYLNGENVSTTLLSTNTNKEFNCDKDDGRMYDNKDCSDDSNPILDSVSHSIDEKNEALYKKHLTIIDDCINFQLPPKQIKIMRMRIYDQITNEEIALKLGNTTSSISSEFSKSLAILEEALDETSFKIIKVLTKRQISTTLESERLLIDNIKK